MSHYVHLGAATTASAASTSPFGFDVDDLAARIGRKVADRVSTEVARAVDGGVSKITAAVGTGVDKFVDSPAGEAVFDKLENKIDAVGVNVITKHKVELALLGVAGLALFMGGSNVAGKMGPRGTRVAFAVGAAALALVASGVFAPPDDAPVPPAPAPPPPTPPSPARRTPVR
jgi:hypothetical protein